ncbi:Crp/Fnr family transcriptional regulator [Flavisphingomonas formosensis]|uniref:Crp/Fnr family transcriptional regulator n=1 Tax=Flavisphingomonas formosensis TaxID=861534 RepID=UPI0012F8806A|nr:Crp/Fnr family transcriptional regulator [Sphingomonas formosensis]
MLSHDRVDGTASFFRAHQYLAREGEAQHRLFLLKEGWACRFRLLPDGRRQITALFLPGNWCELAWMQNFLPDQPVVALTNVRATAIPAAAIRQQCEQHVDIRSAIWSEMIAQERRQSDWIINLGRKSAIERLSHLFCEFHTRLHACGLTYGDQFAMPLTQIDLADVAGLTPVHVNRTLREMRSRGLIELQSKWLRIFELDEIRRLGLFEAGLRETPNGGVAPLRLVCA